jgi:uncharacterized protein YdbL (DUF1318 family)
MRRTILSLALCAVVAGLMLASCRPRVDVYTHAPDEPIVVKLEVHIYQHAVQDVDYITGGLPAEKTEAGTAPEPKPESPAPPNSGGAKNGVGDVLLQLVGIGSAYAESSTDQQLRQVLDSMRKRYPSLSAYKADKSIGENRRGYVEERPSPRMSDAKYAKAVRAVIAAENADRGRLYQIRAQMDGTSVETMAIAYAKVWRDKARPGEWIEVVVNKQWVWKQK